MISDQESVMGSSTYSELALRTAALFCGRALAPL
jgi:hypothetical protein